MHVDLSYMDTRDLFLPLRHDGEFRCKKEIETSEPFALVHKTLLSVKL